MRLKTILLADDHPLLLKGMTDLLVEDGRFEIVAICRNGNEALHAIRRNRPDLALLDVRMPGLTGLEVTAQIRRERIPTRIVLLTAAMNDAELFDAVDSRLDGLIFKEALIDELMGCLTTIAEGGRWMPCDLIAPALEREGKRRAERERSFGHLTDRERTLTALVAEGLSNKEIAIRLGLTEGTVKVHLHNILAKLSLRNRTELATLAVGHEHIMLSPGKNRAAAHRPHRSTGPSGRNGDAVSRS